MSNLKSRTTAWALGVAAVAMSVGLAGCGPSAGPAPTSTGDAPDPNAPVVGGSLIADIPSDEGCVDPQQLIGRSLLSVMRSAYDSLVYQDADSGEILPWLAESWDVSSDGTEYTFHLRDDVTFSDGTPFTADSVKANFDAIIALGAKARLASSYLAGSTGTEVVDDHTVKVGFETPNAAFLASLATPSMGIISDADAVKDQGARCAGVSGTGAFTIDKYVKDNGMSLSVRDDYAWAPAPLHQGRAYLDSIEVQIVPESGVRAGSVVSGAADVMTEVNKPDLAVLGDTPISVRSNPGVTQGLMANPKAGVLVDPVIRQALQAAFDRQLLVDSTLTKYQPAATSVLSAATPGYTDLSSKMAYDPAAAKSMLDADGWKAGADGIREKDGVRASVSLLYAAQRMAPYVPLMELIQQQAAEIGIEFVLRPLPDADETTAWTSGDYELRISALTRGDGDVLRTAFRGLDPKLDEVLNQQLVQTDPAARNKLLAEAQEIIVEQGIHIPINELSLPMASVPAVKGITFTGDSLLLYSELWKSQ